MSSLISYPTQTFEPQAAGVQFRPLTRSADLVACKVCGGVSELFGVVDLNKSCLDGQISEPDRLGRRLALSGVPVYYRRCSVCGFAFTNEFDEWSLEEFKQRIYNDGYTEVDPDYAEARPNHNARLVAETFGTARETLRILDYGGGSGLLAERLRAEGFRAETYDPFSSFCELPERRFELITCFEVIEHVPSPRETVAALTSLLDKSNEACQGVLLFSTLLQPPDFERVGLGWWYAAPRNGHISLYSRRALIRLFAEFGLRVHSFNDVLHMAYGRVPEFARRLNLPE